VRAGDRGRDGRLEVVAALAGVRGLVVRAAGVADTLLGLAGRRAQRLGVLAEASPGALLYALKLNSHGWVSPITDAIGGRSFRL
jgi:hypothetical protein